GLRRDRGDEDRHPVQIEIGARSASGLDRLEDRGVEHPMVVVGRLLDVSAAQVHVVVPVGGRHRVSPFVQPRWATRGATCSIKRRRLSWSHPASSESVVIDSSAPKPPLSSWSCWIFSTHSSGSPTIQTFSIK